MRRLLVGIAATALLMGLAGQANAEPTSWYTGPPIGGGPGMPLGSDPFNFNFAFIGPDLSGSGSLTATPNGDGSFTATAGTLSVFGDPLLTTVPGLGSLLPNPTPPGGVLSPSGFFLYDNQLFPTANPTLDVDGLLFVSGPNEINIWANGPNSWEYYDLNTVTGAQFVDVNFQFLLIGTGSVPEPSSVVLMGLGAVGLALHILRKRPRR